MRPSLRASLWVILLLGWYALFQSDASAARRVTQAPFPVEVTIYAPELQRFVLALDEIELDWAEAGPWRADLAASPVAVAGAKLEQRRPLGAVFSIRSVRTAQELLQIATSLEAANPGTRAHFALYELGNPRSEATRRLLTREVSVLLEENVDPESVLDSLVREGLREIPGVPRAYVVKADNSLAALELAEALRERPGVRSAYPLLKRRQFVR